MRPVSTIGHHRFGTGTQPKPLVPREILHVPKLVSLISTTVFGFFALRALDVEISSGEIKFPPMATTVGGWVDRESGFGEVVQSEPKSWILWVLSLFGP